MRKQELKSQARELAKNRLLPMVLEQRAEQIYDSWKHAQTTDEREQLWAAMRELQLLAGAINDAIREHGGSRTDG